MNLDGSKSANLFLASVTLNTYQALSLLAFLIAFIAYGQTRWWIMSRSFLVKFLYPVRLPDAEELTSLHHPTQAEAIKTLVFKQRPQDPLTSRWFGALSVFNFLVFIVLGSIIPYFLAGCPGSAKVQSRATDACDRSNAYSTDAVESAERFYTLRRLSETASTATRCPYAAPMPDGWPNVNITLNIQYPLRRRLA